MDGDALESAHSTTLPGTDDRHTPTQAIPSDDPLARLLTRTPTLDDAIRIDTDTVSAFFEDTEDEAQPSAVSESQSFIDLDVSDSSATSPSSARSFCSSALLPSLLCNVF